MYKKILIVLIICIAAFLRLNQLSTLPALNADEAAIGYNAYSLLQTGKDEHGISWPVHFKSFNDYKPGLYFYLVMPFVKLIGLTEIAVRLPNVLFGVATVYIVYLLIKQLFPDKKLLPEISALLLAVSPWHIHFSRGGWEVNTSTFFITLGLYLFLKCRTNWKWWLWSAISFICALYTYHSARIIVPLLLVGLFLIYRKIVVSNLKKFTLVSILSLCLLIPLVNDLLGGAGISRASGVGLFADLGPVSRANEQRGQHDNYKELTAKLFHNKQVNYSLAFFNNYLKHFSGEFLFISGDDIQRNKVPEMGQMYLLDLIFILIGLFVIAKIPKGWGIILLWLSVAPIASSFTFQTPHALRAENMVVPFTVISAYGMVGLVELIRRKYRLLGYWAIGLLVFAYCWDITRYLHQYYYHMAKTYDNSSQYGVKELTSYVKEKYDNYDKFIITTRFDQPYILFLFYTQYPPEKFQSDHILSSRDQYGFSTVPEFDKFIFKPIDSIEKVSQDYPMSLIVASPDEVKEPVHLLKTIYFPSGRPAFYIMEGK